MLPFCARLQETDTMHIVHGNLDLVSQHIKPVFSVLFFVISTFLEHILEKFNMCMCIYGKDLKWRLT